MVLKKKYKNTKNFLKKNTKHKINIVNLKEAQKKTKVWIRFLIRKFINNMMYKGKEEKSERLFLSSFLHIYKIEKKNPMLVFFQALRNSKPYVEICSVRKGGATYQIPIPCKEIRGISLSMKWILEVARKKKAYTFVESLSSAFLEASKNLGESVKRRDLIHGTALKNRSLTHYRWF
jgi:small subunit ribosomal protein S7